LLVGFCGAAAEDTVLDVACGGGLLVCAFAQPMRHATGIDVTPAIPNPGDDEEIRAIFRASIGDDRLGIPVRLDGAAVRYAYPVLVLCSEHP
jgi:hypothetical protein